mmetsp:Transcript_20003/g.35963  ORF Transcript_20003/g.35963 Transcript_20003/m.35963 type:complete len:138 (+) Transcript_20003:903-1316(+)
MSIISASNFSAPPLSTTSLSPNFDSFVTSSLNLFSSSGDMSANRSDGYCGPSQINSDCNDSKAAPFARVVEEKPPSPKPVVRRSSQPMKGNRGGGSDNIRDGTDGFSTGYCECNNEDGLKGAARSDVGTTPAAENKA